MASYRLRRRMLLGVARHPGARVATPRSLRRKLSGGFVHVLARTAPGSERLDPLESNPKFLRHGAFGELEVAMHVPALPRLARREAGLSRSLDPDADDHGVAQHGD
jgi:hypothetical protein